MNTDQLNNAIRYKTCSDCNSVFSSQADTLAHFAREHPILSTDQRGPLTVVRTLGKPWRRERTPRITTDVLYRGIKVDAAGWHPETFIRGVEWAIENLGVKP